MHDCLRSVYINENSMRQEWQGRRARCVVLRMPVCETPSPCGDEHPSPAPVLYTSGWEGGNAGATIRVRRTGGQLLSLTEATAVENSWSMAAVMSPPEATGKYRPSDAQAFSIGPIWFSYGLTYDT